MARTTRWTSEGVPVTVTTTQKPGETIADFRARHEARVAAAKLNFPEDAGSMVRSTVWTSNALPESTYTVQASGQSYADFAAAHDARNDIALGWYPPDAPQE